MGIEVELFSQVSAVLTACSIQACLEFLGVGGEDGDADSEQGGKAVEQADKLSVKGIFVFGRHGGYYELKLRKSP